VHAGHVPYAEQEAKEVQLLGLAAVALYVSEFFQFQGQRIQLCHCCLFGHCFQEYIKELERKEKEEKERIKEEGRRAERKNREMFKSLLALHRCVYARV
jgi:hypothetical protein